MIIQHKQCKNIAVTGSQTLIHLIRLNLMTGTLYIHKQPGLNLCKTYAENWNRIFSVMENFYGSMYIHKIGATPIYHSQC